ncbi:CpaE family protein [Roseococcus sp. DSY-14]|uniref:AAA family ATPase n=1 Tax=Roseococcus sp. DSY-14 TaxID=3369650 RepID=UPI00387B111E
MSEVADAVRPDRRPLLCFARDPATLDTLRAGLAAAAPPGSEFLRGDLEGAIAHLRGHPTPQVLVVDASGDPQPLARLEDLAAVVEPDVRVLVMGDRPDLGFYRHLTRGLGVLEYLYAPVTPAMVAETFGPLVAPRAEAAGRARGGRLIAVTGAAGGAGASTVAVALASHLAGRAFRHTMLLDAEMQRGTVPLLLGLSAAPGLRAAMEAPERVDELWLERTAQPVTERLHLLAAEEPLDATPPWRDGAAEHLMAALRRRYSFVVADAPFHAGPLARALAALAHQRVIVAPPSLAGLRDALRMLQAHPQQAGGHRPLLVLNRADRRGALPPARVAEALGMAPDLLLPETPAVAAAAVMGEPPLAAGGAFARGIARLAALAAGVPEAPAGRGLLGRWFGR